MCILCVYNMSLKDVSHYDLSVLSMSVIGSQKKCGWVGLALPRFIGFF